jgi:hypothetical protein
LTYRPLKQAIDSFRLSRRRVWLYAFGMPALELALLSGCEANSRETKQTAEKTNQSVLTLDSTVYQESWNVGHDLEEPEKSFNSRFSVRVQKLSSGKLTIFLDSAVSGNEPKSSQVFVADSAQVTGLTAADRFTQGCMTTSRTLWPILGVLRDSVYERQGRPRVVWHLDTLNARITKLSPDSVSCFIAGPE